MNLSSQLINALNAALGPAFVTATEIDIYFAKTIPFEFAGVTREILFDLFENPEEMLNLERFTRIFADRGVEVKTIESNKPRSVHMARTSQVTATFLGIEYTVMYYIDRWYILDDDISPSEDGTPPRYGINMRLRTNDETFYAVVSKDSVRLHNGGEMHFRRVSIPENLELYDIYVGEKKFGVPRTSGLIYILDLNVQTREEALDAARNSPAYKLFKLIH